MPITAREASLKAISAFRRTKKRTDETLSNFASNMSGLDAALAYRITCGVIQNMALCDFYISQFSSLSKSKLQPHVGDILRLSVYQIVFLDKIPYSAIVNEAVALTVKYSNRRAAGFVNAVLRRIAEAATEGKLPNVSGKPIQRLSVRYSHPEFLVKEFIELLGVEGAEKLLAVNNVPDTPITAQINTTRAGTDETIAILEADGISASHHSFLSDCIQLQGAGDITRLNAFKKGYFYIQDTAARLAVIAASPEKGGLIIDGCAAPGGKSFASAIMMDDCGQIKAFDRSQNRLTRVSSGAQRLGLGIIDAVIQDAEQPSQDLISRADTVLADVPCSGYGVIRRKPEIRYKDENETALLPAIQRSILKGLSKYVKSGGVLLYSTCTLLKRENEDVALWFLDENREFAFDDFSLPGGLRSENGMLTLWPHIHGTDGFFICKLRKKL